MSEQSPTIIELSEQNFHSSVHLKSYSIPILVEFMGFWSEPCILMSDTLAGLAQEFSGQFIFAKVDVDEQTALREEFAIDNVPTLKLFKDGKVVETVEGMMQEDELRDLLKSQGIFRQSDELREMARRRHLEGETLEAIGLLTQAIQQDPGNTRVAMDMIQVLIDINEVDQATAIFNKLPDRDKESNTGRILIGQLTFRKLAAKTEGKEQLRARLEQDANDHDARFDLAICHVAENDYLKAADYLAEILTMDPDYKEGAAREMLATLANMLSANAPELAADLRRKLGNLLAT